ncbi:MAG: hypothetical protein GXX79_14640 [Actinomycetales bacterium]|nr:hypothetical protein [Actinomycetales bacterium]
MRDGGAASLEYAGILFVVVLLVGGVVGQVTPVGGAIKSKICEALGVSCGAVDPEAAAAERARQLGIKCTTSRQSRDLGYSVAYSGIRGERKDTDQLTNYSDGSSLVILTQGSGIGVDASSKAGAKGSDLPGYSADAKATINGDLGYVYSFPETYGGSEAAADFLDSRRSGWQQAAHLVVPGAQSIDEGLTRARDTLGNWWSDTVVPAFGGDGPSQEELARREAEQRANTADAVQVSLSIQGSAGAQFGAGKKMVGADGKDTTGKGALGGEVKLTAEVRGTTVIGLDTGQPDSVPSSFTGSAKLDVDLSVFLGIPGVDSASDIPPFFTLKGGAGAGGSYRVVFDAEGNPTKLILIGEAKYGIGGQLNTPKGVTLPGGLGGKFGEQDITAHEWQAILDLDTSTAEGRANRAAFDENFLVGSVTADGHTGAVVVPHPNLTPVQQVQRYSQLASRIATDAFVVTSEYQDIKDETGGGIKVAGTGIDGSSSTTNRTLVGARGYDNRNGGVEVPLVNCERG